MHYLTIRLRWPCLPKPLDPWKQGCQIGWKPTRSGNTGKCYLLCRSSFWEKIYNLRTKFLPKFLWSKKHQWKSLGTKSKAEAPVEPFRSADHCTTLFYSSFRMDNITTALRKKTSLKLKRSFATRWQVSTNMGMNLYKKANFKTRNNLRFWIT